ncbi:hypothetical protein PULV_a4223 [Pseudoalteromonas ulvae UL12]|nr:hypothetical protein [Pseudoalteromonas ulvae UL12]
MIPILSHVNDCMNFILFSTGNAILADNMDIDYIGERS